ncbi:hypothetical protein [Bradyrhizobium archetypum]|uniref:Uncharacterized protein n=1 Tax=Bradyrhizobium archetypum TaxID=2721160 RepID=A0A7Y4M395_9BRAD|nr:hypothetical protein [Bradyrhizobium archetypum]NOJ48224.1 hypothetical protein [Bradyrhizobium archetypum]
MAVTGGAMQDVSRRLEKGLRIGAKNCVLIGKLATDATQARNHLTVLNGEVAQVIAERHSRGEARVGLPGGGTGNSGFARKPCLEQNEARLGVRTS